MYAASYPPPDAPRTGLAYDALKRRLLVGDFPVNHRLSASSLAAELGVSRTPVRDALSRLHAERLVERDGTGAYVPALPDLDEAKMLYEVRFALELDALTRGLRTGAGHDRVQLEALRADWRARADAGADGADPEFVLVDEDFHVRLAAASGNRALAGVLVTVNERIRPLRTHDFLDAARISETVEQHLGVVEALLADGVDEARRRLVTHFEESVAVVEERAAAAVLRMVSAGRRDR